MLAIFEDPGATWILAMTSYPRSNFLGTRLILSRLHGRQVDSQDWYPPAKPTAVPSWETLEDRSLELQSCLCAVQEARRMWGIGWAFAMIPWAFGDMGNGHVAAILAESHQLSHPTPSHIPNSSTSPFARTFERRMGTSGLSGSGNGCLFVRGQLAWESRLSAVGKMGMSKTWGSLRSKKSNGRMAKSCRHGQGMKVCQGLVCWSVWARQDPSFRTGGHPQEEALGHAAGHWTDPAALVGEEDFMWPVSTFCIGHGFPRCIRPGFILSFLWLLPGLPLSVYVCSKMQVLCQFDGFYPVLCFGK